MRGTIVVDDIFQMHETGPMHPESPDRLSSIELRLDRRPALTDMLRTVAPVPARRADLLEVHTRAYLHDLEALAAAGGGLAGPETPIGPHSFEAAVAAAGAALTAVAAVRETGTFAFALVRPPGHHAHADHAHGFCIINNIAVAAASLRRDGNRVLILDWDAHHGDGTDAIFAGAPDVLYASIHENLPFPGTGTARDPDGGATLNIALPSGTGEATYLRAFDEVIAPVARAFRPHWLLVSAGYDAHMLDPLTHQRLRTRTFARLSARVRDLAGEICAGRLVLVLEGGYDLRALADSVEVSLVELAGEHAYITDAPAEPDRSPDAAAVVDAARDRMTQLWNI